MSTVFPLSSFRPVQDIRIKTSKGRMFVIDIYESNNAFDSTVTVLDNVSKPAGSWLYNTQPQSVSAHDNFVAAIKLTQSYLNSIDSGDTIIDIHNPCNCPFISEVDQNIIVSSAGINFKVRVN